MSEWTYLEGFEPSYTKASEKKSFVKMDNLIRNTKVLSAEDFKKASDAAYNAKIAREESLLAADKEGKLKSEALKKEVEHIKAIRARAAEKSKKKADKPAAK